MNTLRTRYLAIAGLADICAIITSVLGFPTLMTIWDLLVVLYTSFARFPVPSKDIPW